MYLALIDSGEHIESSFGALIGLRREGSLFESRFVRHCAAIIAVAAHRLSPLVLVLLSSTEGVKRTKEL